MARHWTNSSSVWKRCFSGSSLTSGGKVVAARLKRQADDVHRHKYTSKYALVALLEGSPAITQNTGHVRHTSNQLTNHVSSTSLAEPPPCQPSRLLLSQKVANSKRRRQCKASPWLLPRNIREGCWQEPVQSPFITF